MRFIEPLPEEIASYQKWLKSRPKNVRSVASRFEPWELYRLKTTGQRVAVASYGEEEDGSITLTVNVVFGFFDDDPIVFEYGVFGVNPDNLEPLPTTT